MHSKFVLAFALVFFVGLANANSCVYLASSFPSNATITKGVDYSMPLSISNLGPQNVLAKIGVTCPADVSCSLDSSYVTLASQESATVNVFVDTRQSSLGIKPIWIEVSEGGSSQACDAELVALNVHTESNGQNPLFTASVWPDLNASLLPGEEAQYTITITSKATTRLFVQLRTEGNQFAQSTRLSESQISLDPSESKQVSLRMIIPAGTPGGNYAFALVAKGITQTREETKSFLLNTFVLSDSLKLTVSGEPLQCIQAAYGNDKKFTLNVRNDGTAIGPFAFTLTGASFTTSMIRVGNPSFELNQGETTTIPIIVQPSRDSSLGTQFVSMRIGYFNNVAYERTLCINVTGSSGFAFTAPQKVTMIRGEIKNVPILVFNNGSSTARFTVVVDPQSDLGISAQPKTLDIQAGESAEANVVLVSTFKTKLGTRTIPVRIYSSNGSRATSFILQVVSSNKSGESILFIHSDAFTFSEGKSFTQNVLVKNTGTETLHDVQLSLQGLPSSWFIIDSGKTLLPNEEKSFRVTAIPPKGSSGTYQVEFAASSGFESVVVPTVIQVKARAPSLEFSIRKITEQKDSEIVDVIVVNTGSEELDDFSAAISSEYSVKGLEGLVLAPGESSAEQLEVTSFAATAQGVRTLTISAHGVSANKQVSLKAFNAPRSINALSLNQYMLIIGVVLAIILVVNYWFKR